MYSLICIKVLRSICNSSLENLSDKHYSMDIEISLNEKCNGTMNGKPQDEKPKNLEQPEKRSKKALFVQSLSSCPPLTPLSTIISLILLLLLLYGALWGLTADAALPGGPIFALFTLVIASYVGGQIMRLFKIPSLVGMMVCGFILRNAPHINVANDIPNEWAGNIRHFALVLILLRAGLEVDPDVLKSNRKTCIGLIFCPFVAECVTVAIVSHYLLDMPWMYCFLMGFMLSAVSPAVVLPVMLKLQKKGIGVTNGIPTVAIAVAGIDDVLALTGFEVILGITFTSGSVAWTAAKGPTEVVIGIVYGILLGLVSWYIPNPEEKSRSVFRMVILSFGGMFIMFGSQKLDIGAAGALGCICLPFTAAIRWRKQDWSEDDDPVGDALAFIWRITEPFLFGLVGSEIRIDELQPSTIGLGLAILFIGLALRMLASLASAYFTGLTLKEQIFVTFAGMPKATVQAAIGPIALEMAKKQGLGEQYEEYGVEIVTVAVLSILITAPLGATAIAVLAPRLLDNAKDAFKKKPRCAETRISIFDPDSNIYTVARL